MHFTPHKNGQENRRKCFKFKAAEAMVNAVWAEKSQTVDIGCDGGVY